MGGARGEADFTHKKLVGWCPEMFPPSPFTSFIFVAFSYGNGPQNPRINASKKLVLLHSKMFPPLPVIDLFLWHFPTKMAFKIHVIELEKCWWFYARGYTPLPLDDLF